MAGCAARHGRERGGDRECWRSHSGLLRTQQPLSDASARACSSPLDHAPNGAVTCTDRTAAGDGIGGGKSSAVQDPGTDRGRHGRCGYREYGHLRGGGAAAPRPGGERQPRELDAPRAWTVMSRQSPRWVRPWWLAATSPRSRRPTAPPWPTRPTCSPSTPSAGDLKLGFDPQIVGGEVNSIVAHPDGDKVYLGGAFSNVNGPTSKSLALVSLATGDAVAPFKAPAMNGRVLSMQRTAGRLLISGTWSLDRGHRPGVHRLAQPAVRRCRSVHVRGRAPGCTTAATRR